MTHLMLVGTDPVNMFCCNDSSLRDGNMKMEGGTWPVSTLECRSTTVRYGRSRKLSGIVPYSLQWCGTQGVVQVRHR